MLNKFNPFGRKRYKLPMIFQSETAECTLACIVMISNYFSLPVSLTSLRELFQVSLKGLTYKNLIKIGQKIGLSGTMVRLEVDDLKCLKLPVILHWNRDHSVVFSEYRSGNFIIYDPATGQRRFSEEAISKHFSGLAIVFKPVSDQPAMLGMANTEARLGILDWTGSLKKFQLSFWQIILLSISMEILSLMQPILYRAIFDVGVGASDMVFVVDVAIILLSAAIFAGLISYLRDRIVAETGNCIGRQIVERVYRKALSIPLMFFEKRPIGDLISRFNVTGELERFLVSALPLSFLDGLVGIIAMSFLFYIAAPLGIISLIFLLFIYTLKRINKNTFIQKELAFLHNKGQESGYFNETLESITTIKTNSMENERIQSWLFLYQQMMQSQTELALQRSKVQGMRHAIYGLTLTFFVVYSAFAVTIGQMTAGMMIAVLFYGGNFLLRTGSLIERVFEFEMLRGRMDRLEDVLKAQSEQSQQKGSIDLARQVSNNQDAICLKNVAFRYSLWDNSIIVDASCIIKRGEFVAFIGSNGAGKTTLIKIILGFYKPTQGQVLIDGIDLVDIDIKSLRRHISVVSQDDKMLCGSILDNIASFEEKPNLDHVEECLHIAGIKADIDQLPMGLHTRVGGLGSALSEGQKQKLFLARALYRKPKILIMDEGTANLDVENEQKILGKLKALPITKLFIVHREATLQYADRLIKLVDGQLQEVSDFKPVSKALSDAANLVVG